MQHKYQQRFDVVFAYIEQHIDDDISLDTLADAACFSKFHFQRQFSAAFGISANRYISRLRFKRSAYQLASSPQLSISDIVRGQNTIPMLLENAGFRASQVS